MTAPPDSSWTALAELHLEFGLEEAVPELCRKAALRIPEVHGIDRVGLWTCGSSPGTIQGCYGTDENGQLRDESGLIYAFTEEGSSVAPALPGGEPLVAIMAVASRLHCRLSMTVGRELSNMYERSSSGEFFCENRFFKDTSASPRFTWLLALASLEAF